MQNLIIVYEKRFWTKTVCQPMILLSSFYDKIVIKVTYFTFEISTTVG